MEGAGGAAGAPAEDGAARQHPSPVMGAREQPPSKRRRIGVVWDEGNLAKHSAERGTPDPASEEQVFFADPREEAEIAAAADTLRLDDSVAPAVLPPQIDAAAGGRTDADSDDAEDAAVPSPGSAVDEAETGGFAPPAVVPVPLPPVVADDGSTAEACDGSSDGGAGSVAGDDGDVGADGRDAEGADDSSSPSGGAPPRIAGGGGRPMSKFAEMRRKHYDERQRLEEFRRRAEVESDSDEESDEDDDRGARGAAARVSSPATGGSR